MRIRAVTFDYWNTLLWESPGHLRDRRIAAWIGILDGAGLAAVRQKLVDAHELAFQDAYASWQQGVQFRAEDAIKHMCRTLGLDVPPDVKTALLGSFDAAGLDTELYETANLRRCLDTLRDAGVRLGIVCDVGLTPSPVLRTHLDQRGLLSYFDSWAFSDELGVYKPDQRIFRKVLDDLGVEDPGSAAHVGDLVRTDVAGALGAGMTAVRYTGIFDDAQAEPAATIVVADHADIPRYLNIR